MASEPCSAATLPRYVVTFHVETSSEPQQIAAVIAEALDCCHVGPIVVAPTATFSWEDPVAPRSDFGI
jgi:hypothetical protein